MHANYKCSIVQKNPNYSYKTSYDAHSLVMQTGFQNCFTSVVYIRVGFVQKMLTHIFSYLQESLCPKLRQFWHMMLFQQSPQNYIMQFCFICLST